MILTLREDPCVKGVHRFSSATAFSWLRWLLPHRQGRGIFYFLRHRRNESKKRGILMSKNVRWITETAVMLALLIALQALTKPLGQLVTGSCVNAVLAVSVLLAGLGSGITIAVISPVLAFLLGIAPQLVTVPAIMVGNTVFVVLLHFIAGNSNGIGQRVAAWLVAAAAKFVTLYLLVVKIICGLAAAPLLANGMLKEKMLKALPTMFAWPQLITALIGGGVALLIVPVLRKALHK